MSWNYDYYEAVKEDVKDFILEHYELETVEDAQDLDVYEIEDEAMNHDSVTGNASGSYTFNRCRAQEYINDNIDLLNEAVEEGIIDVETVGDWFLSSNFELMDVIVRCHVLPSVIEDAIDEIIADLEGVQA